jgi:hypothetical protein
MHACAHATCPPRACVVACSAPCASKGAQQLLTWLHEARVAVGGGGAQRAASDEAFVRRLRRWVAERLARRVLPVRWACASQPARRARCRCRRGGGGGGQQHREQQQRCTYTRPHAASCGQLLRRPTGPVHRLHARRDRGRCCVLCGWQMGRVRTTEHQALLRGSRGHPGGGGSWDHKQSSATAAGDAVAQQRRRSCAAWATQGKFTVCMHASWLIAVISLSMSSSGPPEARGRRKKLRSCAADGKLWTCVCAEFGAARRGYE